MTFMDLQWLTPDIQICSCNLRIACLLTIKFLFVVSGMSCPVDFIRRSDGSCCKPIQCLENQGYNLCSSLYPTGKDSCYNCSIGTFNNIPVNTAEITYSYQEELCRKIDCDCAPEAELLNRDECIRTGKRECACKRQDLRYGDDPGACEKVNDSYRLNKIRKQGWELKNSGNVGECDQGHFKNKSDDSICIPHSQCPKGFFAIFNGSKTEDRQCQQVTTITPSTKTAVKSVTTGLSRKNLTSFEKEQRKNTAEKHFSNPTVEENKHMKPSFPVGNHISDHSEPSKTKSESDGQILFIVLGIVIGVLVILVLALIICCLHRRKKKDLHKKDSENSDTAHETYGEKRDPAEMNPLLPTITHETQKEIDNNIEKGEKIPKKDDHLGQYTQLLENSSSQSTSSIVSESFSKEKPQEDYVLQTDNGTCTTEEIPLVHVAMKEYPMVREKVKEKIQRTDSTDVIPRVGAYCSRPTEFIPESGEQQFPFSSPNPIFLPTHSIPEPHSTDSLDSNGAYSKLNFNSFGMENPLMGSSVSCQRDSDYETGSSRKNESGDSESFSSFSFGKGLNSLNVNSFDDSSQLSTDTQSSVRTGKSVAVVLPFRGMETVDEEETSSKTP